MVLICQYITQHKLKDNSKFIQYIIGKSSDNRYENLYLNYLRQYCQGNKSAILMNKEITKSIKNCNDFGVHALSQFSPGIIETLLFVTVNNYNKYKFSTKLVSTSISAVSYLLLITFNHIHARNVLLLKEYNLSLNLNKMGNDDVKQQQSKVNLEALVNLKNKFQNASSNNIKVCSFDHIH